ncbi:hypothetical protein ACIO3O_34795 [Streptomyces sp. NPDC087440]|uniref:hypothetical protein n=1 Tax=Streptomyces sp. NPDC087440 TaxID=3365790 RepID=UPI0038138575
MTSGLSDLASEEFCHLARTITEAGNPAGAAGRMTEGQRRAASRSAARILVEHAGSSYQTARDRAAAGVPTLPDVCLSQAALMSTWWTHTDPRSADVHTGWRQACDEASMRAMEPVGEATAVYVLGAVFHSVAQETNTRADAFQTLPYTRGLPLIRNSEAAARIVTNFVSPPQWEETGFVAKRLAIYLPTAPMFRVLRLWADLLCAAHAADCPQQGPGHECTLSDRTAALAPHSNVAA